MSQKWNLQDIRPAEPRKRRPMPSAQPVRQSGEVTPSEAPQEREREQIPSIIIQDGTKKDSNHLIIAIVLFVVIVGGTLGLSTIFGKTTLTVYPQFREPNINSEFTAYPDKRENSLSYTIMTIESASESQVKASGQIQVETQATGAIEIIKTTPGAERLITNTRFRSPNGLVFRIRDAVVVPGAITDSSGTVVPGTIQAQVFADDTGEEYNLAAGARFDIPGFQESGLTELYDSIYAENRQPFTGGFSGPQYQIDEAELGTARQALQIRLRDELLARIESEKPNGFVAFPGATAITYNQLPTVEYGQDLVTIKEQAILQIPLFNIGDLGAFLAREAVATYSGGPVRVDEPAALMFSYASATSSASIIANEPSLTFTLRGKPLLIWEYDSIKLTRDIAGLPKNAINNVITAYPAIESAIVNITPFWKRSFPTEPESIVVIEELKREE
jgi:hypothetical protein